MDGDVTAGMKQAREEGEIPMQSAPGFPVPCLGANACLCPVCKAQGLAGGGVSGRHGEGEASLAPRWPRVGFNRCLSSCAERARGGRSERVAHGILNRFGCKERTV